VLKKLELPGYKVMRWERDLNVWRDPRQYPAVSLACTGTHDTEPLAVWWASADEDERAAVARIPSIRERARDLDLASAPFTPKVRDMIAEALIASGSDIVLFPVLDVLGWPDRINEPATVGDANWTYRLPWPIDRWDAQAEACERQRTLRAWVERYDRTPSAAR
jgi:4-alpha-glucanotransferase